MPSMSQQPDAPPAADHVTAEVAWRARAEALRYAAQLQPEHLQAAQSIYQQGGWPALRAAIAADGVSEDALGWLTDRLVENRGDLGGLGQTIRVEIERDIQTQQYTEDLAKRVEASIKEHTVSDGDSRGTRGTKENSRRAQLLRDPAFHEKIADLLAPRYGALAAQSLGLEPGESPGAYFFRIMDLLGPDATAAVNAERMPGSKKWDSDQAIRAAAQVFQADPDALRQLLAEAYDVEVQHALFERIGQRDDRAPQPGPPDKRDQARIDGETERRAVLARKADEIEAAESRRHHDRRRVETPPTPVAEPEAPRRSRKDVLRETIDALEAGKDPASEVAREAPEPPPPPPPRSREEITAEDRREALSRGYDELAAESDGEAP